MPSYDPQRNRPRQRPKDDEPVPVDALLGDTPAVEADDVTPDAPVTEVDRLAVPATAAAPAAPPEVHGDDRPDEHLHDEDCAHGPDPAMALAVAVLSAFGAILLVTRLLRRRRRPPQ